VKTVEVEKCKKTAFWVELMTETEGNEKVISGYVKLMACSKT
jgi:hypothetical protein